MAIAFWNIWLLYFCTMHHVLSTLGTHFHHSHYKVHHEMGKMKIKVKPEGAKLVFTGGDLDVEMHPAHGFVRPVHNIVVSHEHEHEHYHEEPEVYRHEIEHEEHEEEEEHSGHHMHEYHHSYHHDDHDGHHDDHEDHHDDYGHHDDEGYGFRHFIHWPIHGLDEKNFIGHEFFNNHHEGNQGHYRDEIGDGESNQNIDVTGGERRDNMLAVRRLGERRPDSSMFGKKIYPEDIAAPTHKSNIENKLSEFAARIVPGGEVSRDTDEGSTPDRTGGTLSPYDEENDKEKYTTDASHTSEDTNNEEQSYKNTRNGYSREHDPKINYKHLEKIANSIPPSIPEESEFHREAENGDNSKDLGGAMNMFVNMSGLPHSLGEENNEEPYPTENSETDSDNMGQREHPGEYNSPSKNEEDSRNEWNPEEGDEGDVARNYIRKFNARKHRLAKLATEGAKKKDTSPPLVVHPVGDPREMTLKRAFYEYKPTHNKEMHLASINDLSVRDKITDSKTVQSRNKSTEKNYKKRSLMIDALIANLKKTW